MRKIPTRLWCLLAVTLMTSTVFADDATERFKAAQKHYDAQEYEEALAAAQDAAAVTGSPNARLYVARALAKLGRFDEAYREMAGTLRSATDLAESQPKYVPTRDAAAAELALLTKKVVRVVVAIVDPPQDTVIELNGRKLERDEWGETVAVLPGTVTVKATAPGATEVTKNKRLSAGETHTFALSLEPEATETSEVDEPEAPATVQVSSGGDLRTVGYVAAGVGVVGLGVFAIAGASAKSKHDTLEEECGSQRCTDPKYADVVDSGKRAQTIANIGLGVGVVGVLAGGALILFGGPQKEAATGPRVQVGHGGGSLSYFGRF